jgi:dUTP pyrophosphatase
MQIKVEIRDSRAVIPSRAHASDIGLDLPSIDVYKILENTNTVLFDTGIAATPPEGYYLEVIPRSSLSKTGWMLANSVGIIDPHYTGNIYIALTKISEGAIPMEKMIGKCVCQLVLRKAEYANVVAVTSLGTTERGDGGFGSTGDRV